MCVFARDIETRLPKIYIPIQCHIEFNKQYRPELTGIYTQWIRAEASACIVFLGFVRFFSVFSFIRQWFFIHCILYIYVYASTFVNLILCFETKEKKKSGSTKAKKKQLHYHRPKCSFECQYIRIYLIWLLPIVSLPNTINLIRGILFFICHCVANFMLKFYCDVIFPFQKEALLQSFCQLIQTINKITLTTQNIKR